MPSDPELNFIYKIEAEVIVKKEIDRGELKTFKKKQKVLLTSCYHEYFISSVLIFENEYYI